MRLVENKAIAERLVSDLHGNIVTVFDYPEYDRRRGRALRCARRDAGLTMGALARALDLSVTEVAGVEHGRYLVDEHEWRAAIARNAVPAC